uniref:Uncharacterized protein n=1 Tax=Arundo donax TaxID=35708 RepID=A0A0A9HXZ5_ARUDO
MSTTNGGVQRIDNCQSLAYTSKAKEYKPEKNLQFQSHDLSCIFNLTKVTTCS